MTYKSINGNEYNLSYKELKNYYNTIALYDKIEFLNNLPTVLHIACMICFLKEIPSSICLSDEGIIHELTHLLTKTKVEHYEVEEIMNLFKETCKLH